MPRSAHRPARRHFHRSFALHRYFMACNLSFCGSFHLDTSLASAFRPDRKWSCSPWPGYTFVPGRYYRAWRHTCSTHTHALASFFSAGNSCGISLPECRDLWSDYQPLSDLLLLIRRKRRTLVRRVFVAEPSHCYRGYGIWEYGFDCACSVGSSRFATA